MPFKFLRVPEMPDLVVVEPKVFKDNRGFFLEVYEKRAFWEAGIVSEFVQDNHSMSSKGVIRGLHYQKAPYEQAKLVRCTRGKIFDVAVDIRVGSPTFGKWFGIELSEENKLMLYIPRGFAHGFLVLSDIAEVQYKVDNFYAPEYEGGIVWNDPDININWGIENPILSEKDSKWPKLRELFPEMFK